MVAILIPTKDRPEFVKRQLEYYALVKSPHAVYVADGSSPENQKIVAQAVEKAKKHIKAQFIPIPPDQDAEGKRYPYAAQKITEPSICFCGDDDFQIPETLTKAENFLEKNPTYSMACFQGLVFNLPHSPIHGKIQSIGEVVSHSLEQETAAERISAFLSRYFVTTFGVLSRENYLKVFSENHRVTDRYLAGEVLPGSLTSIIGKVKALPDIGIIRQDHPTRNVYSTIDKWFKTDYWQDSYTQYIVILSRQIAATDGINTGQAQSIAQNAFKVYQAKIQAKIDGNSKKSLKTQIKNQIGQIKRKVMGQEWMTQRAVQYLSREFPYTQPVLEFIASKEFSL